MTKEMKRNILLILRDYQKIDLLFFHLWLVDFVETTLMVRSKDK